MLPRHAVPALAAASLALLSCPGCIHSFSGAAFSRLSTGRDSSTSTIVLARRGRREGTLKEMLDDGDDVPPKKGPASTNSLNKGKGQEITGVTLPAEGTIKGWEFGNKVTMACANVNGRFYALQGACPRCAFDLWKGDLIGIDDPAWEDTDTPRVACPTCSTTFSFNTGKYGPALKRTGFAGFVGSLAKSATAGEAAKNAKAFAITLDEDGRVYCKEKPAATR